MKIQGEKHKAGRKSLVGQKSSQLHHPGGGGGGVYYRAGPGGDP